ncbi:MAG TPA: hypothetical protein PKX07_17710, partial [Aggregatilineales bacterium]|nr:hypothetical protein [Aggregatilineales bacterium]
PGAALVIGNYKNLSHVTIPPLVSDKSLCENKDPGNRGTLFYGQSLAAAQRAFKVIRVGANLP